LHYASAPIADRGYTFWIDEVKFEKLGSIGKGQAGIMNGSNVSVNTFVGVNTNVTGLISTFNLPNGINQSVNLSRAYFEFKSSNAAVATVNANGNVSSLSAGSAIITATLGGVQATGSLTINCAGSFVQAPTPTSTTIKCDFYFLRCVYQCSVNYYNGYWAPFQTTLSSDFSVANNNVLHYTNFNFVGIEFSAPTVNASTMTNIHLDVFSQIP
jgi:hypothetical protein